ncbi:MAG: hypothetical protein JST89_20990 [Cyanobacteria bacterium SZAS-4]|nr:hypothetical protein [Cyanobacteria bacterium SZAS-4]
MEITNSPKRFICLALLSAVAMTLFWFMLAERSKNEALYREYLEQGRKAESEHDFEMASSYWVSACYIGKKIGANDREIGDLYVKLSDWDKKRSRLIATEDARQAISHYKKVPNTNIEQIRAEERLVSLLPLPTDVFSMPTTCKPFDLVKCRRLSIVADSLLKLGKLAYAIRAFDEYLNEAGAAEGYVRADSPTNLVRSGMKSLDEKIKAGDPLASYSLPLMHDWVYYAIATCNEGPEDGRLVAISMLDKMIAKTGRDPNDWETRKRLGDQSFERHHMRAAIVEYERCLGMREDEAVRLKLRKCAIELSPNYELGWEASETLSTLGDLKKLNAETFGVDSKQVTEVLRKYAWAYRALGDSVREEQMRKEILTRVLSRPDMEERNYNDEQVNGNSPKVNAYTDLLLLYDLEGKFAEARKTFNQAAEKLSAKERYHADSLRFTFQMTCLEAGWLKESAKLRDTWSSDKIAFQSREIK